jgi:hypothetical protein
MRKAFDRNMRVLIGELYAKIRVEWVFYYLAKLLEEVSLAINAAAPLAFVFFIFFASSL